MKILIADDDRVLATLLSRRLQAEGAETTVAFDAMQAIMFAQKENPAVILLDVNMPGGNGLEVLKRIKASAKTYGTEVIVVTASTNPELEAQVKALGANEFLPKPVDYERLLSFLGQLAEEIRQAGSQAQVAPRGKLAR